MSTITVKYPQDRDRELSSKKEHIREQLITTTATVLSVNHQGVIVNFEPWGVPTPEQAPVFLLRAETSVRRRSLLIPWAEALLKTMKTLIVEEKLPVKSGERIAVKPYVLDSEWVEITQE